MNKSTLKWPWIMLVSRTGLFALFQAFISGILAVQKATSPWIASAKWWPITATLGSFAVILIMIWLYRWEGISYWSLFRFQRKTFGKDILISPGILLLTIPVAMLPNILLARFLYGDSQIALEMLIQPLPDWAVWTSILIFPLTIAFSELPMYFAYVLPRLECQINAPGGAVGLVSFWLAAQHICLPFLPDARFIIWRLFMFLPFAIMLGIILHKRPRLLPYMVTIHWMMDLSTGILVLLVPNNLL